MKEIPIKAKVNFSNGDSGESKGVVIDREALKVTWVVVEDKKLPGNSHLRLVPFDRVADALHDRITLSCSSDEVAQLDPYGDQDPVPDGGLHIRPGMKIHATNGRVGKLDEFLLDQKSGVITNLLMLKGHLWGKKDVVIPVDKVDQMGDDTITLKIDKEAVGKLTTVSANRG